MTASGPLTARRQQPPEHRHAAQDDRAQVRRDRQTGLDVPGPHQALEDGQHQARSQQQQARRLAAISSERSAGRREVRRPIATATHSAAVATDTHRCAAGGSTTPVHATTRRARGRRPCTRRRGRARIECNSKGRWSKTSTGSTGTTNQATAAAIANAALVRNRRHPRTPTARIERSGHRVQHDDHGVTSSGQGRQRGARQQVLGNEPRRRRLRDAPPQVGDRAAGCQHDDRGSR